MLNIQAITVWSRDDHLVLKASESSPRWAYINSDRQISTVYFDTTNTIALHELHTVSFPCINVFFAVNYTITKQGYKDVRVGAGQEYLSDNWRGTFLGGVKQLIALC